MLLAILRQLFVSSCTEILLSDQRFRAPGRRIVKRRSCLGTWFVELKRSQPMIKKCSSLILLPAILALTAFGQRPAPPQTHLKVGQAAPEFTLTDTEGKEVKLSDFRGKKNVVLAFYVLAFTGG
jgi:hypothetical protein